MQLHCAEQQCAMKRQFKQSVEQEYQKSMYIHLSITDKITDEPGGSGGSGYCYWQISERINCKVLNLRHSCMLLSGTRQDWRRSKYHLAGA